MRRYQELKRFDLKTRNKLRAIFSDSETNAIDRLARLRGTLGSAQAEALDSILNSRTLTKAVRKSNPFPKAPPFSDTFQLPREVGLSEMLGGIEASVRTHKKRLSQLAVSLREIDTLYAEGNFHACRDRIDETLNLDGWSHALLRRIIFLRENLADDIIDDRIEELVVIAGIKEIVVSSLINAYARDQNILTIKKSIINIPDRGVINRYSRTLCKMTVQPFASSKEDLSSYLSEVERCSLLDAVILAKFNSHLYRLDDFPNIKEIAGLLGPQALFESLLTTYDDADSESEYLFFKQSTAWLEYEAVRDYRILTDNYYDASREEADTFHPMLGRAFRGWVGEPTLRDLVGNTPFTKHGYNTLSKLELSGTVTRSALFNYWLTESEGQIGFDRDELLTLMGLTRDLARTVPIKSVRTAAKLASDDLVKLILLLLLAKRSKNELDSFLLRKLLESIAFKHYEGSLVALVEAYHNAHPYVAEYIYDISTEDFLSKLPRLAPHRADISEIRASLHESMAKFKQDDHYLQRARAVRIDHQINRVRNEIDDHRIYVDPSRFSSWLEDEMMIEISRALTSTGSGKKGFTVTCDDAAISWIVAQSYTAFCSNPVFGIASYIGRRIRHGTFHGHLYSSVINSIEKNDRFTLLLENAQFATKWANWKDVYNKAVELIIAERLHVQSKAKPFGLLTPEVYSPPKAEVLSAAVKAISGNYAETGSATGVDQTVIDYCWRLAEVDLIAVVRYLRVQQTVLKNQEYLSGELVPTGAAINARLTDTFRRELERAIDRKFSNMYGWFKRPSIVAPKASVSLLFAATVAEVRDTIPDFDPQIADNSKEEIELVGNIYHLIYDSLAIVVGNAAKYADRKCPLKRSFEIVHDKGKHLVIDIRSSIKCQDDPAKVSEYIEARKVADFQDANMYDRKSGISKLLLLASSRPDFTLDQYAVIGNEVRVRLIYALEH